MEQKRVVWIDIYKALVIILVVLGHATGLFNSYIYQFHMAAFFFISGYTSNIDKRTLSHFIINKFFTILMPLVMFVFMGDVVLYVFEIIGIREYLFDLEYLGFGKTISVFLKTGDLYIQFLGACWFLVVLFGVFVIQKIVVKVSGNRFNEVYIFVTLLLYSIGYYFVRNGIIPKLSMFPIDLILIAQLFFAVGCCCKIKIEKYNVILLNKKYNLYILILNVIILYFFSQIYPLTVDYPSRHFTNAVLNAIEGVNGIMFCFNISRLLEEIPKKILNAIIYIGKNSMGIFFFHFAWFKILNCIFYKCNMIELSELKSVVPTTEIGNKFWSVFVLVSLGGSLVGWEILKHIPIMKWLLGFSRESYKNIEKHFKKLKCFK